jgi:hypothetical protein
VGKTDDSLPSEPPPPVSAGGPLEDTDEPAPLEDSGSTLPPPLLPLEQPGDNDAPDVPPRLHVSCSTGGGQFAVAFGVLTLGGVLTRGRRRRLSPRASDAPPPG